MHQTKRSLNDIGGKNKKFSASKSTPVAEISEQDIPPRPFVKWAGGKRALLPQFEKLFPQKFESYWEPCVGGGAVFFHLLKNNPHLKKSVLCDLNTDLIHAWQIIKEDAETLITVLAKHADRHDEKYYYKIRSQHNLKEPIALAARLLYLNKACFNGLWRVNSKNEFNVPIGAASKRSIICRDNLRACNKALQKTTIKAQSFEKIKPCAKDFIYIDPPYDETFRNYQAGGFQKSDQSELRDAALKWHIKGAQIMISNSDTENIRKLYSGKIWNITEVHAPRVINSNPNGRGLVTELVIRNYE